MIVSRLTLYPFSVTHRASLHCVPCRKYVIRFGLHLQSLIIIYVPSPVLRSSISQVYNINFGLQEVPVFCHMGDFGCGDGGWTLAVKIDGSKVCYRSVIYSSW